MAKLSRLSDSDHEKNNKLYDIYFNKIKWIDGWTKRDKVRNFNQMLKIEKLTDISFANSTCLDIGCGTGDLVPFLRKLKTALLINSFPPTNARIAKIIFKIVSTVSGIILNDLLFFFS